MKSGSWSSYQSALPPEARAGGEPDDEHEPHPSPSTPAPASAGPALLTAAQGLVAALVAAHRGIDPILADRAYHAALAVLQAATEQATTPTQGEQP